jgi:hypothetical protein
MDVICPHCLAEYTAREMCYRDDLGNIYQKRPRRVDGVLDKVCPECDQNLPLTSGRFPSMLVGLVGARGSGKSTYVGALVHQIRHAVGARFGCTLQALDTATQNRYHSEFSLQLWEQQQEIPPTSDNAAPLLYEMRFHGRDTRRARGAVTLALYDTAGEAFEQMSDIAMRTPYLDRVSGLVLLIDPLQADEIRDQVMARASLPEQDVERRPLRLVENVASVLRQRGLMHGPRQFQTPVAVTVSKADVLTNLGLVRADEAWNDRDLIHDGSYDPRLHRELSEMWEQRVLEWAPRAHNAIKVNFAETAFFGVTATGCSSDENRRYPEVSPWRVEEPLLWLLHRLGVAG